MTTCRRVRGRPGRGPAHPAARCARPLKKAAPRAPRRRLARRPRRRDGVVINSLSACPAGLVLLLCFAMVLAAAASGDLPFGLIALYTGSVLLAELFAFRHAAAPPSKRRLPGYGPILACATLIAAFWTLLEVLARGVPA